MNLIYVDMNDNIKKNWHQIDLSKNIQHWGEMCDTIKKYFVSAYAAEILNSGKPVIYCKSIVDYSLFRLIWG